jgi:hypothetical protein
MTVYELLNNQPWLLAFVIGISVLLILLLVVIIGRNMDVKIGPVEFKKSKSTLDLVFAYADYVWNLKDEEHEQLECITKQAREYTKRHVHDTMAQLRAMNGDKLREYRSDDMIQDHYFNVLTRGDVWNLLTKELMEIYEANHLLEMTDLEYQQRMRANFGRIMHLVVDAFASSWAHPDYPITAFAHELEKHQSRGEHDFMILMGQYKALAEKKMKVKEIIKQRAKVTRDYIKEHGHLPEQELR